MTALTPEVKERQRKARARVYRIREGMRNYIHTLGYIAEAFREGDWKTLGYATWEKYLAAEFGADQVKLPPEQRQKALRELRLEDMPNRALGAAMNVDEKTIRRDRAAANAAPIEGEIVDSPARSPLVEATTGAIEDAAERIETAGAGQRGPAPAPDHPGSSSPGEGAASAAAQEEDSGSALGGSSSTAAGAVTPAAPAAPEHLTSVADGAGPGEAADVQPAAAAAAGEPAKPAAAPDPGVAAPAEEADAASSHDSSGEQGGPATSPAGPSCEKCGDGIDDDGYRRCSGCDPDGMHTASDDGGCRLCALLATVPDEYLPIQVGEGVHGLQLECGCGAVVAHLKPGMPIAVALIEARLHHGSCQWSAT